jgi:hypothetical protein
MMDIARLVFNPTVVASLVNVVVCGITLIPFPCDHNVGHVARRCLFVEHLFVAVVTFYHFSHLVFESHNRSTRNPPAQSEQQKIAVAPPVRSGRASR